MSDRACKATTKAGKPCKAPPLDSGDFCIAHDRNSKKDLGFGGSQPGSGRPPKPRIVDVLRERVENEIDEWLEPFYEGRTATRHVVVGNGPTAHVEEVPDIPTRMAASREVLDRTHGKSKQVNEITGADGGPVKLTLADLIGDDDEAG